MDNKDVIIMNALETCIGNRPKGKQIVYMFVLIILLTFAYNGFSYPHWPSIANAIFSLACLIMLVICFANKNHLKNANYTVIVLLFTFIPYLSIINNASIYGQSILSSMARLSGMTLVWMLYFILHIYRVKESTILYVFLCTSLFVVTIQIVQQLTYPNVIFGIEREETIRVGQELTSVRNNLYRFHVDCNMYYTAPFLFVVLNRLKDRLNFQLLCILVLLLSSVYLTLTRQIIFSIFLLVFCSFFLGKKNMTKYILMMFLVCVVVFFYENLFGQFTERTGNDLHKDYIRILAAKYFWDDSIKSVPSFCFGYGVPSEGSLFENYVIHLRQKGFYAVDVGFIGMIWKFGIIYVIVTYYMIYSILFKNKIPSYIKWFIIYVTSISIMIFPFEHRGMIIVFPLLLYICDLHINKSVLAL